MVLHESDTAFSLASCCTQSARLEKQRYSAFIFAVIFTAAVLLLLR